jgi:hypothetical protein
MSTRVLTVRLPDEQITDLETVASFDGVAMAELLRAGVELLLQQRRNDPDFRKRVEAKYAEAQRLLKGVPGGEAMLEVVSRPLPDAGGERESDQAAALDLGSAHEHAPRSR